ncbi:hypothetical protein SAVCW2_73920 [Streptomyces avermitilis]|nr:hypothetical protein SAVCW2_73920 [Streptomyces avermitilis]
MRGILRRWLGHGDRRRLDKVPAVLRPCRTVVACEDYQATSWCYECGGGRIQQRTSLGGEQSDHTGRGMAQKGRSEGTPVEGGRFGEVELVAGEVEQIAQDEDSPGGRRTARSAWP